MTRLGPKVVGGAMALGLASALAGCQADPLCRASQAAVLLPTRAAYDSMSPRERRNAALRFDETARRCGWEP